MTLKQKIGTTRIYEHRGCTVTVGVDRQYDCSKLDCYATTVTGAHIEIPIDPYNFSESEVGTQVEAILEGMEAAHVA